MLQDRLLVLLEAHEVEMQIFDTFFLEQVLLNEAT